jgi:hypothetical protein
MTDKLFIRYNKVMQKVFEKAMDEVTTKEQYFSVITRAREQFEKETIDGLSVERSLKNDIEKEGIDNVLDMALTVCDMYLPYSLITILHESIGTEGIKHKILDETRPEAERASLINALAGYETEDITTFLIGYITTVHSDLLKEEASDVLATFNKDTVYSRISDIMSKNRGNEDLLSVLASMFRQSDKSDSVYRMLREHFLSAEDKGLVANIMADLDNAKAVVFLRGYLSRNINDIGKSEIADICSAISRMGGNAEDFMKHIPDIASLP